MSECACGCGDSTVGVVTDTFKEAVGRETEPSTYRWYVTELTYNRIYDEVTPTIRFDAYDVAAEFCPNGMQLQTEYGMVDIRIAESPARLDDEAGQVVARRFDGNAALVRYKRGESPDDQLPFV